MSKFILVAGGAGFIGSHLCERLLREGHRVICVDNLCTGSMENIRHLMGRETFTFLHEDIRTLSPVFCHEIYNMACIASPIQYAEHPLQTVDTCYTGVKNLLMMCARFGAKFLQASTSEVYGDPAEHPQKETYFGNVNPYGERSCYDEGKRVAETLCYIFRREHGVSTRIARIFNTYGPRMSPNDGRVIPTFIHRALAGENIPVFGDGTQTRSLCYINDMLDGLLQLMASDIFCPVNLGNPEEITVRGLAERIISLTRSASGLEFHPLPQDDPTRRRPDITKAKTHLGWSPKITLDEGLKKMIAWYGERRGDLPAHLFTSSPVHLTDNTPCT